jgi:hypothetical protein
MIVLIFLLLLAVLSTGFYFYFLSRQAKRLPEPATTQAFSPKVWDVYAKGGKLKVLPAGNGARRAPGLAYAFFFHWWTPIGLWRYGFLWTLGLLVLPIATAALAAFAIGYPFNFHAEDNFVLGSFLATPLRGRVGVYLTHHDLRLRARILIRRGWQAVGSCEAKSAGVARALWQDGLVTKTVMQPVSGE